MVGGFRPNRERREKISKRREAAKWTALSKRCQNFQQPRPRAPLTPVLIMRSTYPTALRYQGFIGMEEKQVNTCQVCVLYLTKSKDIGAEKLQLGEAPRLGMYGFCYSSIHCRSICWRWRRSVERSQLKTNTFKKEG